MALDSLLASLKSGVAEVTGVQASRNMAFACNLAPIVRVAKVAGVAAEIQTATPETSSGNSWVTVQSAPTEACTHETLVTPKTINCEVSPGDTATAMTASEETALRAWLEQIEETDLSIIAEVIGQCQRDANALNYFTGRAAAELPNPDSLPDDRRICSQCRNLRQRSCAIAKPEAGALVVANRGYRPDPARLLRCAGYAPLANDSDQRTGAERWPGIVESDGPG